MSTKCTIDCDNWNEYQSRSKYPKAQRPEVNIPFHAYYECGDEDNIYLELSQNQLEELRGGRLTIKIPGTLWNRFVRIGELKSWGGEDFFNPKTPEQRSKEFAEGLEDFCSSLEEMAKRDE